MTGQWGSMRGTLGLRASLLDHSDHAALDTALRPVLIPVLPRDDTPAAVRAREVAPVPAADLGVVDRWALLDHLQHVPAPVNIEQNLDPKSGVN